MLSESRELRGSIYQHWADEGYRTYIEFEHAAIFILCLGNLRQTISRHRSINQKHSCVSVSLHNKCHAATDEWRLSARICNIASAVARRGEKSDCNVGLSLIRADVDEWPSWCYADEMADTGRGMTWAHLSKPDVSSFPEHLYLMSPHGSLRYKCCWLALGCFGGAQGRWEMSQLLSVRRVETDSDAAMLTLTKMQPVRTTWLGLQGPIYEK